MRVARLTPVVVPLLLLAATAPAPAEESAPPALEYSEKNARAIEAYNAAILAAQGGRLVEAIAMLESFLADDPPEALAGKAAEQLELIRAERRKAHVVEFNRAVKLLKKKKLEDAESILRGILADDPGEKMERSVSKQLAIIAKAKPARSMIVPEDDESDS